MQLSLKNIEELCKTTGIVPNVIHRLLLYDKEIPSNMMPIIREFNARNNEFYHVLWKESDLLAIMNEHELSIYNSYKKNIQKSDYGRYIVLKYFGGIYCDFDIKYIKPLISLYDKYKNDCLFFEENTLKELPVRSNETPCLLRIANYFMMHKRSSVHIQGILDICNERKSVNVQSEQDVIFTTGPDVVSFYFDKSKDVRYINKMESGKYFIHLHSGHWREKMRDRK